MQLPVLLSHPECTWCELHDQGPNLPRHVGTPTIHLAASLRPNPSLHTLIFVGQNPGFHEDKKNIPFIGKSGKVLRQVYIPGTSLHERCCIYLTNCVRCHTDGNEPPKTRHIRDCAPRLIHDITTIYESNPDSPLTVIALGAVAVKSIFTYVLGIPKISLTAALKLNGNHYPDPSGRFSFTIFSTYHPAAVVRDKNYINPVSDHMQLVSDHVAGISAVRSTPHLVPWRHPPCPTPPPPTSP